MKNNQKSGQNVLAAVCSCDYNTKQNILLSDSWSGGTPQSPDQLSQTSATVGQVVSSQSCSEWACQRKT